MPKVPPADGRRSLPRLVGGWLLLVLAGGLVLVAVLAVIGSAINGDIGAVIGGVFVLIVSAVLGQFGRVVLRGGHRPPPTVAVSGPGSERAAHGQRSSLPGPPEDPSVRSRRWRTVLGYGVIGLFSTVAAVLLVVFAVFTVTNILVWEHLLGHPVTVRVDACDIAGCNGREVAGPELGTYVQNLPYGRPARQQCAGVGMGWGRRRRRALGIIRGGRHRLYRVGAPRRGGGLHRGAPVPASMNQRTGRLQR